MAPDARPAALPLPPLAGAVPDSAGRADLTAREREVERAEALRRLSDRIFEAPELGLGWKRIEDQGAEASGPVVSAGWTVPLFDRRQADRREAEARLSTARADLELARVRAQAERAGALAAFERLRAEAAEAEKAAAATADLLAGASASYQLGESGLTDFLDTLRAALAARISALEVREAALDAQRDLESAAGRPLTGELP
jgi:outer membrane protein TolC